MLISKVNATLKIVYHLLGGDSMSKHLTLSDRITIATGLKEQKPINQIANELGKNCSTISREIRKHITRVDKGAAHRVSNRCVHRKTCNRYGICENNPNCIRKCATCARCNSFCQDYIEEKCERLSTPPYVCNGCKKQSSCVLRKAFYYPEKADQQYHVLLSEARQGYNMTTLELRNIDEQISPLLKNGQSIHHACVVRGAFITVSENTVSRLVKDRQLSATVLGQQRVVKLKPRKRPRPEKKVDRHCRERRTIEDYLSFQKEHPKMSAVEMDSVFGQIGGKSLLTLIFPQSQLMLAFLCDCSTAACVQSRINFLYEELGLLFTTLFLMILTDNGY